MCNKVLLKAATVVLSQPSFYYFTCANPTSLIAENIIEPASL